MASADAGPAAAESGAKPTASTDAGAKGLAATTDAGARGLAASADAGAKGLAASTDAGAKGLATTDAGAKAPTAFTDAGVKGLAATTDARAKGLAAADAGAKGLAAADAGAKWLAVTDAGTKGLAAADAGTKGLAAADAGTKGLAAGDAGTKGLAAGDAGTKGLAAADAGAKGLAAATESGAKELATADSGTKGLAAAADAGRKGLALAADAGSKAPAPAKAKPVTTSTSASWMTSKPKPARPEPVLPTTYEDQQCRACHGNTVSKKFKHSQMKDGACSDCHLPAVRSSRCETGMSIGGRKTTTKDTKFSLEVSLFGWRLKDTEPTLCTRCHEGIASDEPIHKAVKQGGCSICHDAHSEGLKKQLKAPVANLCAKCHRKDDRRHVHEPVAKGECTACHDPHTGLEDPLLKETRADLCSECHPKAKLSPARHVKAPKGDCFECHVAHASDEKGLLKPKGTPEIASVAPSVADASYPAAPCQKCHAGLTKQDFRHSVFKQGSCADCHAPGERAGACQEAVGKGWQLKASEPRLCTGCHDKLQKTTPLHPIIAQRGCTACHDPHGSKVKGGLKLPLEKLCNSCHQRRDTGKHTHRPILDGNSCLKCHDPHSGVAAPLLKNEPGLLCLDCHKQKQLLPELKAHEPVEKGRCLECHNAHGTNEDSMLLATGQELCLRCHEKGKLGRDGAPAAKTQIAFAGAVSTHNPKAKDGCQGCHVQTHSGRLDKLVRQPTVRLCLGCHDVRGKTDLHKPIKDKGCPACHQPHASENKKLLVQWPIEKLCHSCHEKKDLRQDMPVVHAPVQMGECLECHGAHSGEEKPLLKVAKKDLCTGCHELVDLAPRAEVHSPVKEGKCFGCHDAHGSEVPKLLLAKPAQMCVKCHQDPKKADELSMQAFARIDIAKKVVHRPLVEKDCQECHVAGHSGKIKKLLKKKPAELCYGCHERKDQKEFVHGAVRLGDCPVCHKPHSSDQRNLAPWGREAKICFECHEDDISLRAVLHKPVAEGRCSKCHDPHSAPYAMNQKFGPAVQGCVRCHEKIKVDRKVKHTPLVRYGCTVCHDPHGAGNVAMLPKPINDMCTGCHPKITDGMHAATMMKGGHVVTGPFDPRRPDRAFSCASCHNPHGSDNPRLFYAGKDAAEMCDDCHGDRLGKSDRKDITKKKPLLPDGGVPVVHRYDAGWLTDDALAQDPVDEDEVPTRPPPGRRVGTLDGGAPMADVNRNPAPKGARME